MPSPQEKRSLEIDLNLVSNEPEPQMIPFPASYQTDNQNNMMVTPPCFATPDASAFAAVQQQPGYTYVTPQYGLVTPPYVGEIAQVYSTPVFDPAMASPAFGSPMYPYESAVAHAVVTPPYGSDYPCHFQNNGYKNNKGFRGVKVSCRIHNVVKRVRAFCLKRQISVIDRIEGDDILKISARTAQHCQKLENTIRSLINTDGVVVEALSLPPSIDITKRKRGFLVFMKLANFEKDESQVRKRFNETGLDFKIKLVNSEETPEKQVATPTPTSNKDMSLLLEKVAELTMEVQKLQESNKALTEAAISPPAVSSVSA